MNPALRIALACTSDHNSWTPVAESASDRVTVASQAGVPLSVAGYDATGTTVGGQSWLAAGAAFGDGRTRCRPPHRHGADDRDAYVAIGRLPSGNRLVFDNLTVGN